MTIQVTSPVPYGRPRQAASCRGLLTPLVSSNNLRIVSSAWRVVFGPAVREQRQLDQTGIDHGEAGELPAHPLKPWPVSLQGQHPGLDHLHTLPLGNAIGQGIEATLPPSAACNPVCSVMVRISLRIFSVRIN
jgi:hypothetical protein